MRTVKLTDLDLLDFGNAIQLWGVVYEGGGQIYFAPFPDSDPSDLDVDLRGVLVMDRDEWTRLLFQTDVNDVRTVEKAVLRKSLRHIDQMMAWAVFERDGYRCRYCGANRPLTVDHVDLWEDGGATVPANLISACRPCNKTRGRTPYGEWLASNEYLRRSSGLSQHALFMNAHVATTLAELRTLRRQPQRSR